MRLAYHIRAFALACAILALSVPLMQTSTHIAAACSNPGCVVTATTPAQIDSYVSPLSVTAVTTTFFERQTTAQTQAVTIPGSLSFTVMDARGNNEGFIASITASTFTSSLFPLLPISNTAILVTAAPTVSPMCYGPYSCGVAVGVTTSLGQNLGMSPAVAAECPASSMGEGQYAVTVPLSLQVTGLTAEKLGSYPASYSGTFTVSVMEGQPPSAYTALGCPASSTISAPSTTSSS